MNKRIAFGCIGPILVIPLLLVLLLWSMFGDRSSYQTKLDSYPLLPKTASDITVYENKNISGYFVTDFKIIEREFVLFATEQHWDLRPISAPASIIQAIDYHEGNLYKTREITNGLYYSKRAGNGGGVTVAYDRDAGRAYIESSRR